MTEFETTLLELFRFCVMSAGLTYFITQAFIFRWFRRLVSATPGTFGAFLGYLVYCPACAGTWIGAMLQAGGALSSFTVFEAAVLSCVVNRLMPTDDVSDELHG